jgi:hypothetical protein
MALETSVVNENMATMQRQADEVRSAEIQTLKSEYGEKYQKVLDNAVQGAMTLGMDRETAEASLTSAAMVKAMASVLTKVSEDQLVSPDLSAQQMGKNYREQALDIMNNPNNPLHKAYFDPMHPQHEQAVRVRSDLNKKWHDSQK